MAAVRALHDLGAHHRVALVGCDDVALRPGVEPALTVVTRDRPGWATPPPSCCSSLDGDRGPARRVVLPNALVERGSGEIPPPG